MTHDEAQARREELAAADPDSTFIVAGSEGDGWKVVKVGIAPAPPGGTPTREERPRPPHPDDVKSGHEQRTGGTWGGVA